jgi:hypothetical protein
MAKIIKLVADSYVEKPSPKPRVMEYRYMLFTVSQDGVVTRVGAYDTEAQAIAFIDCQCDRHIYRIVDMNCIIDAW